MKQWIAGIISRNDAVALPVMTHPGIEELHCSVTEAVTDGRVHSNAVVHLARRYPTAAATTIMDLTVEAEAFGAEVVFSDHAVPSVTGRLLTSPDAVERLQVPSLSSGRIAEYLRASLLASSQIFDRPVIGGCIGPFSLAGRLYGMSEMMVLICEQPAAAHLLLQKCTRFILKYVQAIKMTGAGGVLMAEPAAGLLSADDCLTFSSHYVKQIVEQLQGDSFIVVLHNCGNTGHCTQAMVATGAAAFHFGNKCRMEDVLRDVPPTALAIGNLDPVSVFKTGLPSAVRSATLRQLQLTRQFPNFVISSGCDIAPLTPYANIEAFFTAVEDFNSTLTSRHSPLTSRHSPLTSHRL